MVIQDKLINNSFVASKKDQENSIDKIKQIKGVKFIYPGHGYCRPFDVDELNSERIPRCLRRG